MRRLITTIGNPVVCGFCDGYLGDRIISILAEIHTLAVIQMRHFTLPYFTIILLTVFSSCNNDSMKCEAVQEWKVQNYKIVKSKCPDMVLAFHYEYDVYAGDKRKGSGATQVDNCIFTWQADNESFLTLNACNNSIQEFKPRKISLDTKSIDSVTMFSNEFKQTQVWTATLIETFANDWNNSKTRGYSENPFDSAFFVFPAYQYKLTVFSKGVRRAFYGYNYLILDSSNWEFEMSKKGELSYFHNYWKK